MSGQLYNPAALPDRQKPAITTEREPRASSRAGVDVSQKGNNSDFCREANLGWSSRHTEYAIPASSYSINNTISKVYSDKFEFSILNPAKRDAVPSPASSAVGHERVKLYLYFPYGPYGLYRASVSVQG